jgi:hypothetical protein
MNAFFAPGRDRGRKDPDKPKIGGGRSADGQRLARPGASFRGGRQKERVRGHATGTRSGEGQVMGRIEKGRRESHQTRIPGDEIRRRSEAAG